MAARARRPPHGRDDQRGAKRAFRAAAQGPPSLSRPDAGTPRSGGGGACADRRADAPGARVLDDRRARKGEVSQVTGWHHWRSIWASLRSRPAYGSRPPPAAGLGWVSRMNAQAIRPEAAVRTAATPIAASRLARAAVTPPIRAPIA